MTLTKRECRKRMFEKAMGQVHKYLATDKGVCPPETKVTTVFKGYNMYITVSRYGRRLNVALFTDGHVRIDVTTDGIRYHLPYYLYDEADDHDELLRHFRHTMNRYMKWYMSNDTFRTVFGEDAPEPYKVVDEEVS